MITFFLNWFAQHFFHEQEIAPAPQKREEKLCDKGIDRILTRFTKEEITKILRYINLDRRWPTYFNHEQNELGKLHEDGYSEMAEEYIIICLEHGLIDGDDNHLAFAREYYIHEKLGWDKDMFFERYPKARWVA